MTMIKTVKGVKAKLLAAQDAGFKYCNVFVDYNHIGAALITDILDSINYCSTPNGKIKTFIHRGYEYSVDEGIEINILTNEEFQRYYLGMPCNKGLQEKEEDKSIRDMIKANMNSVTRDLSSLLNARTAWGQTNPSAQQSPPPSTEREPYDTKVGVREPKAEPHKEGFFKRFQSWLKGDVGYKR